MSVPNLDQPSIDLLPGGLTVPAPPEPRPGDWVQVWAQVKGGSTRPEDMLVTLESKSDQLDVAVRREHVESPSRLPDFVHQCTRMFEKKANAYIRCTLHADHNMDDGHVGPKGERWWDTDTAGYFEER